MQEARFGLTMASSDDSEPGEPVPNNPQDDCASVEEAGSVRAGSEYSWMQESDNDRPFYEEKPETATRSLEERKRVWRRWLDARVAWTRRCFEKVKEHGSALEWNGSEWTRRETRTSVKRELWRALFMTSHSFSYEEPPFRPSSCGRPT